MGTGRPPLVPVNTIDVFRPDTLWGACRMALGVTNLGQLLVDQATQTDGRVTARAQALCSMLNIPYFRLNPQLTENVALDETNTKILVKMLWETTAYMRCMKNELEHLKNLLTT
ncbi:85/ calcium-independent phospholipase A2 [Araneus ventricosus]|nr:85/ calcium-independent phospholipase A2 [Araneus ventricosus]GBN75193.1 85/ calcium-independent phospholipase A2 [Araneus ventricosus]